MRRKGAPTLTPALSQREREMRRKRAAPRTTPHPALSLEGRGARGGKAHYAKDEDEAGGRQAREGYGERRAQAPERMEAPQARGQESQAAAPAPQGGVDLGSGPADAQAARPVPVT